MPISCPFRSSLPALLALTSLLPWVTVPSVTVHAATDDSTTEQPATERLSLNECRTQLDSLVAFASNETAYNLAVVRAAGSLPKSIDRATVDAQLAELEKRCPALPQVAHNRGVLAGKSDRWPEAISHFERSLQLDRRAADTYDHLQQIFRHRAAKAYADALGSAVTVPEPELDWQDSTALNADSMAFNEPAPSLKSVSTLEYELYSWWQALQGEPDLASHYVDDFPAAAIRQSSQHFAARHWEDMQREITFTTQDAVAVISDEWQNRTLLLLRLVGNRWKIYQETRL